LPEIFDVLELPRRLEPTLDRDEATLLVEAASPKIAGERIEPEAPGRVRLGILQQ